MTDEERIEAEICLLGVLGELYPDYGLVLLRMESGEEPKDTKLHIASNLDQASTYNVCRWAFQNVSDAYDDRQTFFTHKTH